MYDPAESFIILEQLIRKEDVADLIGQRRWEEMANKCDIIIIEANKIRNFSLQKAFGEPHPTESTYEHKPS